MSATRRPGHIRHDQLRCFELHRNLMERGAMLPGPPQCQLKFNPGGLKPPGEVPLPLF